MKTKQNLKAIKKTVCGETARVDVIEEDQNEDEKTQRIN